jgi:hypothetical protein
MASDEVATTVELRRLAEAARDLQTRLSPKLPGNEAKPSKA